MYKLVVLCSLAALALAVPAPQFKQFRRPLPVAPTLQPQVYRPQPQYTPGQQIPILRQESNISPEGNYAWAYETGNGIAAQENGQIRATGPESADKKVDGSFSFTSPEGIPIAITYVADENGFQAQGDAIPTPPPVPEAILRALQYNAAHPEQDNEIAPQRQRFF